MKTKKQLITVFLILMFVSLVLAAGPASAYKINGDTLTLRLAHVNPSGSPTDKAAQKLVETVNKQTNGTVDIKIFPNEQLGVEKAALEGVMLGTIDCSLNDAAYLADMYSALGVLDFPYTYRDFDHYAKMVDSDAFNELAQNMYDDVGIKVIAPFLFGRRMLCSNRPVFTPEDAEGLKIRTPTSELALENARVLGGEPTSIAYTEAYMGLKQGVADAAENPFTGIYDMKWYEVTKYLVITEHVWNNEILSVSKDAWEAMTPEQQDAFASAGVEAAKYKMKIQKELEDKRMQDLQELGMHIIIPSSLEPFRARADEIKKKYRDKYADENWGEWHDQIVNLGQ